MVIESFAPSPSQVGAARHFAIEAAQDWGCDQNDLSLVVSELATNACIHAHSRFTVSLHRHRHGVLVEVSDRDPTPAIVRPPSHETSGRGMMIVDAIARDWGISGCDSGKSVWAVLSC